MAITTEQLHRQRRLVRLLPELLEPFAGAGTAAWERLMGEAREARAAETPSVVAIELEPPDTVDPEGLNLNFLNHHAQEVPVPPPSRHDYRCISTYYFPNPDTPDGLPYVTRSAHSPECRRASDILDRFNHYLNTLTEAWLLSGDRTFAEAAARHLRAFFIHEDTRMTPHMTYAQHIPGRPPFQGWAHPRLVGFRRGEPFYVSYGGMISAFRFAIAAQNIELLAPSGALDESLLQGLRDWFRAFLNWMRWSQMGRDEATAPNNHATWWHAQAASYAHLIGDRRLLGEACGQEAKALLLRQIEPDGRQPHELSRHVAWNYVAMNTSGFCNLALLAEDAGIDLWNFETDGGRGLRAVMRWLVACVRGEAPMEGQNLEGVDHTPLVPILYLAGIKYRDPQILHLIDELPGYPEDNVFRLLYPTAGGLRGIL